MGVGESPQILEDRALCPGHSHSHARCGALEHLSSSRGALGGNRVFLGHLSCWHLPVRNRVPGPEPPGHCPDLPPRHRLVRRGLLNLPTGSSDPGRKAQRILARNEQDKATQAEVPDALWGCHQVVAGVVACRGRASGWGPCSLTSSLGPNEKLYSL